MYPIRVPLIWYMGTNKCQVVYVKLVGRVYSGYSGDMTEVSRVTSNLNLKDTDSTLYVECALSYHWTRHPLTVYRKDVDVVIIESVKRAQTNSMVCFGQAKASARGFPALVGNEKIDVDRHHLNGQTPSRWNEKTTEVCLFAFNRIDSTSNRDIGNFNGMIWLEIFRVVTLDTIQWEW